MTTMMRKQSTTVLNYFWRRFVCSIVFSLPGRDLLQASSKNILLWNSSINFRLLEWNIVFWAQRQRLEQFVAWCGSVASCMLTFVSSFTITMYIGNQFYHAQNVLTNCQVCLYGLKGDLEICLRIRYNIHLKDTYLSWNGKWDFTNQWVPARAFRVTM